MIYRHTMIVSVVAGLALLAPALTPQTGFGGNAAAQPAGSKGPDGPSRAGPGGGGAPKSGPSPRSSQPAVNRGPSGGSKSGPQRSSPPREMRGDRGGNDGPNRIVIRDRTPDRSVMRDGDRRRGDGDRQRGTRYVWGPGIAFYFYDGFYHGDCSWLRRKARETGSSYWRRRYEQCRD